jgi:hypothetical protein
MFDCKRGRLLPSNYSEYSLETSPGELTSLAVFRNICRSTFPVPLGSQLATVLTFQNRKPFPAGGVQRAQRAASVRPFPHTAHVFVAPLTPVTVNST